MIAGTTSGAFHILLLSSPLKLACECVEKGPRLAVLRWGQKAYALQISKGLLLKSRVPQKVLHHAGVEDLGVCIELRFNDYVAVWSVLLEGEDGYLEDARFGAP